MTVQRLKTASKDEIIYEIFNLTIIPFEGGRRRK